MGEDEIASARLDGAGYCTTKHLLPYINCSYQKKVNDVNSIRTQMR